MVRGHLLGVFITTGKFYKTRTKVSIGSRSIPVINAQEDAKIERNRSSRLEFTHIRELKKRKVCPSGMDRPTIEKM
jgi:hypothetical protein